MTGKPQPLYGEDELKEALRVVYRIRMVHNGEYVLTSLEAADLIHRRYSYFKKHQPPEDGIKS